MSNEQWYYDTAKKYFQYWGNIHHELEDEEPKITVQIPTKWRRSRNNRSLGQIKSHLEKEIDKFESETYNHENSIRRLHIKIRVLEEQIDLIEEFMMKNKARNCPVFKKIGKDEYLCRYREERGTMMHWEVTCSKCRVRHPETRILAEKLKVKPIVKT